MFTKPVLLAAIVKSFNFFELLAMEVVFLQLHYSS